MEFASVFFVWLFLPSVIIVYNLAGVIRLKEKRTFVQNTILTVFSLLFYLWGGVKALMLLAVLILFNYGAGLWIDCFSGEGELFRKSRKGAYLAALLVNLVVLAFFKYFNMMLMLAEILLSPKDGLRAVLVSLCKFEGTGAIQIRRVTMPLALSFVIFQIISYLTDVYKKKISPERNLIHFTLYISFFAQLTQGPIMRYEALGEQIRHRELSGTKISSGITRFCCGLGKKVIIGNTIAAVADRIWTNNYTTLSTAAAWLGIILYTLQIYYDFSGYSDMAVGVGRMFGFDICENFNYPYTALSVQEFWRRWHISLSNWFRDYLYFPLGGNRRGKGRTLFNLFVVFLVTGIWHGANLTFIFWGLYYAVFSILERLFLGKLLKKNPIKLLNWIYCLFVVMMGWVLFRAPNLYYAIKYYRALFCYIPEAVGESIVSFFNAELFFAVIFGILFSGVVQRPLQPIYDKIKNSVPVSVLVVLTEILILAWSLMLIMGGSYNPSIYGAF